MLRIITASSKSLTRGKDVKKSAVSLFQQKSSSMSTASSSSSSTSTSTETDNKEKPVDETAKLHEEIKDLKDQLLRAYAEGENIRRIAHRDVDNARAYANSSFAKAMLEISDDLERAMSVVPADKRDSGDATLKTLVAGIEMTDKNLQKVFNKFGVVRYGNVNDKFDPNIHEALFQIPDHQNEADTVGQIVKMGYKIKDRVLRPAQVGTRVRPN